ncbi:unnamed protein product [Urochloa humidicola]
MRPGPVLVLQPDLGSCIGTALRLRGDPVADGRAELSPREAPASGQPLRDSSPRSDPRHGGVHVQERWLTGGRPPARGVRGGGRHGQPGRGHITDVLHNKQEFLLVAGVEDILVLSIGSGIASVGSWTPMPTVEGVADMVNESVPTSSRRGWAWPRSGRRLHRPRRRARAKLDPATASSMRPPGSGPRTPRGQEAPPHRLPDLPGPALPMACWPSPPPPPTPDLKETEPQLVPRHRVLAHATPATMLHAGGAVAGAGGRCPEARTAGPRSGQSTPDLGRERGGKRK